jgi:hypothetical protein
MKQNLFLIFLLFLLLINGVYAADFNILSVSKQTSGNVYRGDSVLFQGTIQASSDNICKIACSYSVGSNAGYVSDSGNSPADEIEKGISQTFPFSILAEGNGQVNTDLYVTCTRVASWVPPCTSQTLPTQSKPVSFSFLYPGDGKCTTTKEKCADFGSFLGTSDCSCSQTKQCRPDGNRNPDSYGCENYCGNGICEKSEGESCVGSTSGGCNDCKKCNLATCSSGSECEGGYCVWDVCWNKAYRTGDGKCDSTKGESCGNSPSDCACQSGQRCSTTTNQCETYCGNNICETSEQGVCKSDCKWCGDGSCDSSQKENCKTCQSDCGVCESSEVNKEIQETTQQVVETSLKQASERQKILTFGGIGAILIVVIGYILFKVFRNRKSKKVLVKHKKAEIEDDKNSCSKCGNKLNKESIFCKKCGHKNKK